MIHVFAGDEEIKTTKEHPFYVEGLGWVGAENLEAGDKLRLYSGKVVEVKDVKTELLNEVIKVYNFEVEDWHTYFVSDEDVLVHNTCGGKSLNSARRSAVNNAWKQEKELLEKTGRGTRFWTESEKLELLETGKVKGYQGHHINSVKGNPELAGDPNNITFLEYGEHLDAHGGNWRNPTSGDLINR